MKISKETWQKWAEENSDLFTGMVPGAKIGLAVGYPENKEEILILEKQSQGIVADARQLAELERPVADILFMIDEQTAQGLVDSSDTTLADLLVQGGIRVQVLRKQQEILSKGYKRFLNKLGLVMGDGCC